MDSLRIKILYFPVGPTEMGRRQSMALSDGPRRSHDTELHLAHGRHRRFHGYGTRTTLAIGDWLYSTVTHRNRNPFRSGAPQERAEKDMKEAMELELKLVNFSAEEMVR